MPWLIIHYMCVLGVSMWESAHIQDCRKFHQFTANRLGHTHARLPDSIYVTGAATDGRTESSRTG